MIQAGFEFEFGHNIRLDLIKQIIKYYYPKNKIYTVADDEDDYDVNNILSKNYFIFKKDQSVAVYGNKYMDTEMVTPVFVGKKAILHNFKKIFQILKSFSLST